MDLDELGKRIRRLERDNKRLKIAGSAVVLVVLAAVLTGALPPQAVPDLVVAREFRLIGADGETEVRIWNRTEHGSSLGTIEFPSPISWRVLISAHGLRAESPNRLTHVGHRAITLRDDLEEYAFQARATQLSFTDNARTHTEDWSEFASDPQGAEELREVQMPDTTATFGRVNLRDAVTGVETVYPVALFLYGDDRRVIWGGPQ